MIAGCVSTAFFCLLSMFVTPLFAINDDIMIESVLSGSYLRPYPYTHYLSAELGWILSGLYLLLPSVPWFGLFYGVCHVACMSSLLCLAAARSKGWKHVAIAGCFVILGTSAICFQEFVLMHYTVLAALLGATGLLLFLMARNQSELVSPIMYFLLCYLVRENVFFMLAPFIVIAFLFLLLQNGIRSWKEYLPKAVLFAAAFLVLFAVNRAVPGGKEWKAYLEYNEVRTEIYDYLGIHSEEEALLEYEKSGVTKADVDVLSSYDLTFFDDGTGNLNALKTVAGYGEQKKQKMTERLVWSVKSYVHRFLLQKDDFPFNAVAILLYAILFVWYLAKKRFSGLLPLAGLGLYRSAFWIYLFYKGRYPDRVIDSLYYMEFAFLAAMVIRNVWEAEWSQEKRKSVTFLCCMAAILCFTGILGVKETRKLYREQAANNEEGDLLLAYMAERPGNFYFLDVYALVGRTKPVFKPTGNSKENYLWMGGWMTRHPLCLEKLSKNFEGKDNATDALTGADASYLVLKEGVSATKENVEAWIGAGLVQVDAVECNDARFLIYEVAK